MPPSIKRTVYIFLIRLHKTRKKNDEEKQICSFLFLIFIGFQENEAERILFIFLYKITHSMRIHVYNVSSFADTFDFVVKFTVFFVSVIFIFWRTCVYQVKWKRENKFLLKNEKPKSTKWFSNKYGSLLFFTIFSLPSPGQIAYSQSEK